MVEISDCLRRGLKVKNTKRYFERDKKEAKKRYAEVPTPIEVVREMVERLDITPGETMLEITCGEAPFLTTRYDIETGKPYPFEARCGVVDILLRSLNDKNFFEDALKIYKSVYAYDIQPENVLAARENLFLTFLDNYYSRFKTYPKRSECLKIATVIRLNVWVMDGLNPRGEEIIDWKNKKRVRYENL